MHKIAFNTANYVARFSGYRFELSGWGEQDRLTRERTDAREFAAICREIAEAGYAAVEIWSAHLAQVNEQNAKDYLRILHDHGLAPIGVAGVLDEALARKCHLLGISTCNSGLWGTDLPTVSGLVQRTGVAFNYENHPEKSAAEIRERIADGTTGIGIALDIGWLGTAGVDAPAAIRELGTLIRHVHLKNVAGPGAHHTTPLDQGCIDMKACIAALKQVGYAGWYSWEDEPEDRNPMDIAGAMRLWMTQNV